MKRFRELDAWTEIDSYYGSSFGEFIPFSDVSMILDPNDETQVCPSWKYTQIDSKKRFYARVTRTNFRKVRAPQGYDFGIHTVVYRYIKPELKPNLVSLTLPSSESDLPTDTPVSVYTTLSLITPFGAVDDPNSIYDGSTGVVTTPEGSTGGVYFGSMSACMLGATAGNTVKLSRRTSTGDHTIGEHLALYV